MELYKCPVHGCFYVGPKELVQEHIYPEHESATACWRFGSEPEKFRVQEDKA